MVIGRTEQFTIGVKGRAEYWGVLDGYRIAARG
jgi:hypothetical protein